MNDATNRVHALFLKKLAEQEPDHPWVQSEPPIMRASGAGFTARVYMEGQRDHARRHLRRKYSEGVQIAFEYFENSATRREELMRLRKGYMR